VLPVDAILPELLAALATHGAVVLEAPPGTGKTTRVPAALADRVEGQVWVLEPRRVAARAAARRVAAERGGPVGGYAGYAMRFDRASGPETRVLYVTEALLGRRMAVDPDLRGVGAVVLDEFHERSVHVDLALARVHALRRRRPDLALVVMSATIDGEAVARWLGCPRLRAEGTLHPVEVGYLPRRDERPVEVAVSGAVREVLSAPGGDVLVFLPGVGEIERCLERLAGVDADVLPLHGDLEGAAQDRVLQRSGRRRVILATNVAETSLTLDGVTVVVDTGSARVAGFDAWSGTPTLELQPISRASAAQRAGRAGRQGPGRCLRLYTREEHDARPADSVPEIRRIDLCATALELAGRPLDWFEAPPPGTWKAAVAVLRRLGALDEEGRTPIGEAMIRLPVPPRVGRLLVEGAALGVGREAAALAAVLGGRSRAGAEAVDVVQRAFEGRLAGEADRERRQLVDLLGPTGARPADPERALTRALFVGFPDRVGSRRAGTVRMCAGGSALLDAPGGDGFVVVPAAERVGHKLRVRAWAPLPADWLLDEAEVVERVRDVGERVELVEQLVYGEVVVEESVGRGRGPEAEALLARMVAPVLHRVFPDAEAAATLVRRVEWLRALGVELPAVTVDGLVQSACVGRASFAELAGVSLMEEAFAGPLAGRRAEIDRLAPAAVPLGNRQRVAVAWPEGQEPYLASRMQDFFGLADGPRAAGRPIVLHLTAPSGRPVQVTTDLAGFWERHWPAIRRELMRRYPRHYWPEDPLQAEPPPPGRRRP